MEESYAPDPGLDLLRGQDVGPFAPGGDSPAPTAQQTEQLHGDQPGASAPKEPRLTTTSTFSEKMRQAARDRNLGAGPFGIYGNITSSTSSGIYL